jgi:SAM-dependent methyltransferase
MSNISRPNMLDRQREIWRPPSFTASQSLLSRLAFALRRFFDLQAASIWRDLAAELPQVQGAVVDVGCGAQPYRTLFPSGVQYIGIDTADAEQRFGYAVPETKYFEGTTWPLADRSVNFVLCTETLEHVLDVNCFLNEAARCLVPGGRILLTVPFSARWHYIPYDYWRFTPSALGHLLKTSSFVDIQIYARGNAVTVACYKTIALILLLLMPQGKPLPTSLALRLLGVPFLPLLLALVIIGQLSLLGRGGDDCLGYTAWAAQVETAASAASTVEGSN